MVCELVSNAQIVNEIGVLILILMEYGLRGLSNSTVGKLWRGLNPCFNGIWSASRMSSSFGEAFESLVLILVLMEYGLRGSNL